MPCAGGWGTCGQCAVRDTGQEKLELACAVDQESVLIVGFALLEEARVGEPIAGIDPSGDGDPVGGIERWGIRDGDLGGLAVKEQGAVDQAADPVAIAQYYDAGVAIFGGVRGDRTALLIQFPPTQQVRRDVRRVAD